MTREQRLARAFVDVTDTLVSQFDVIDFLHTLTERIVDLLRVDAAGVLLADQRGWLRVIARSTEAARLLELFERQNFEGPCLDCTRTGDALVNIHPAEVADRWPSFHKAFVEAGFQSVHALPMRLRDTIIGSVNIFSRSSTTLRDEDLALGQALTDVATISLLQQRAVHHKGLVAEQLQMALNRMVLIEQAKGVLSERVQLPLDAAFHLMRSFASRNGRALTGVAADVINGSLRGEGVADSHRPVKTRSEAPIVIVAAEAVEGAGPRRRQP